jgi:hypothetical protein
LIIITNLIEFKGSHVPTYIVLETGKKGIRPLIDDKIGKKAARLL